MSYVDELTYDEDEPVVVDEALVQRRVDDWLHRLNILYRDISTWADQTGWSYSTGAPVCMDEELMRRAGLPPREQATLALMSPKGGHVWIKPKGLWVIGANGRVDLYSADEMAMLVDSARPFEAPQWTIHHFPSKPEGGQAFDPEMLAHMV